MSETIRSFIAIPIGPETSPEAFEFLSARRRQLLSGSWAKRVRWVAPEQFHLTLRFLGQLPSNEIPALAERLEAAIRDIGSFSLNINQPCLFPRASRAKVIACPVTHQTELKQLARRVEAASASLSISPDGEQESEARPYRAHITLGRIRPTNLGKKAPNFPSFPGEATLTVEYVDIVASQPFEEGVRHEVVRRLPL